MNASRAPASTLGKGRGPSCAVVPSREYCIDSVHLHIARAFLSEKASLAAISKRSAKTAAPQADAAGIG